MNMSNLVAYTPVQTEIAVTSIRLGEVKLKIAANGGPNELNHINLAAFALLDECLFDLRPNEIQFLGGMTRVNSISIKQRKWLKDLLKKHLGIDIDAQAAD